MSEYKLYSLFYDEQMLNIGEPPIKLIEPPIQSTYTVEQRLITIEDFATERVIDLDPKFRVERSAVIKEFTKYDIRQFLEDVIGKERIVRIEHHEWHGSFLVTINEDAKRTLELWIKVIDALKAKGIRTPIFLYWAGKYDVTSEEHGRIDALALKKMGLALATEKSFNASEWLERD